MGAPGIIYSGISCSKPCGNCGKHPNCDRGRFFWRPRRPPRRTGRPPTRTTSPPTTTIPADPPSSTDDPRAMRAHPENETSRSKTRRSDEGMPYWHSTEEETGPPVAAGDPVTSGSSLEEPLTDCLGQDTDSTDEVGVGFQHLQPHPVLITGRGHRHHLLPAHSKPVNKRFGPGSGLMRLLCIVPRRPPRALRTRHAPVPPVIGAVDKAVLAPQPKAQLHEQPPIAIARTAHSTTSARTPPATQTTAFHHSPNTGPLQRPFAIYGPLLSPTGRGGAPEPQGHPTPAPYVVTRGTSEPAPPTPSYT